MPFQLEAGSQTSILTLESAEGFSVAATRQNAGRLLTAFAPAGVNEPAGRSSTAVIVVLGTESVFRVSHGAESAYVALITITTRKETFIRRFMISPFCRDGSPAL